MENCKILSTIVSFPSKAELNHLFSERKIHQYVVVTNAYSQYLAKKDKKFRLIHENSLMNLSDSLVLKKSANFLGAKVTENVLFGSDLMFHLCKLAKLKNYKVGFFGSDEKTLNKLRKILSKKIQNLNIIFYESPPFRNLTKEENMNYVNEINMLEVDFLFIGLGCPKQEQWMYDNHKEVKSTMFGVGAAFEYTANEHNKIKKYHSVGIGWLYRIFVDPIRLSKRYFIDGTKFLYHLIAQKYF